MKHHRICVSFSPPDRLLDDGWVGPAIGDGRYLVMRGSSVLLNGRTFHRAAAEDIAAALDEAYEVGFEETVEG